MPSMTPTTSFFRFVFGFLVFIAIFFGITIAVNRVAALRQPVQQAAAVIKAFAGLRH